MKLKHWQDLVNALLGVWLILSPWALGFEGTTVAMTNAVVIGLALIAAALGAIFVPRAWEEWTEGILGLWMIVSPWALGFGTHRDAMLSAVIGGVVIAALALWTLATDKDYNAWLRGGAAQ
ncbi:MAG: SPW repeat protein [Burkholderiaceae bacterium]